MGMFDYYEPDPTLSCPACGARLSEWQGKDGPNALLVWRQGQRCPVNQAASDDHKLDPGYLRKFQLPAEFDIYTACCGGPYFVEAVCRAPDGVWTSTELITYRNLWQHKEEHREEFKAHMRWLEGK
jgi:hypothetical protein